MGSFSKNQIVSILAERQGRPYDIVLWEELKDMIDYWRATIIKQTLQKEPGLERHFIQPFVMTLEKVSKVTCPISYGCILRTTEQVPTPLKFNNSIFTFVGSADFEESYTPTAQHQLKYKKYRPYTFNTPGYIYLDNYLYIVDNPLVKYIGVQGIITDLKAMSQLTCPTGNCYSDDSSYPAPDDVIQQIIQAILATEFRQMIPKDDKEVNVNNERS